MNLMNIQNKIMTQKWLLEKKSLYSLYTVIQTLAEMRVGGLKGMIFGNPLPLISKKELIMPTGVNEVPVEEESGDMAVIGISGILCKGASKEEQEVLGIQDTDEVCMEIDKAAEDPSVSCIILAFSSPGGETCGIEELGRRIKQIDETVKPVYVWTESHMNSAAYWLGSQGSTLGMTPSAEVGSVGVYMLVLDASEKYKQEGIKVQAISSGKWKLMGHDFEPLKQDERELLQKNVEDQHQKFKEVVLAKRPEVSKEALEGLSYEGQEALDNGLVDIVCDSFAEFLTLIQR